VGQVDTGVDDRDIDVDPLIHAVDLGGRAQLSVDPVDAGGQGLRIDAHRSVALDEHHTRVVGNPSRRGGAHPRRVTADRVLIGVADGGTGGARVLGGDRPGVGV
jgi:hypothetical protein